MKKLALSILLAGSLTGMAQAHDSWLEPGLFQTDSTAKIPFTFYIGHNGEQQSATLSTRPDWLVSLKDYGPRKTVDILKQADFNPASGLRLRGAGTHVLALETSGFLNEMDADAFSDYLEEEGLAGAQTAWSRSPITARKVRESYRRHAKALVQVGASRSNHPEPLERRLGFALEIVPGVNPYFLQAGERMPATIWYQGNRLEGALVTLGSLDRPTDPLIRTRSDANGNVSFMVPDAGRWMMNVVWSIPVVSAAADFETSFSSLTFAIPAAATAPAVRH